MKRIICILTAVAAAVIWLSPAVSIRAAEPVSITAQAGSVRPGGTVTVTVTMSAPADTSIYGIDLWLRYDSAIFEAGEVTAGTSFPGASLLYDTPGIVMFNWTGLNPQSGEGTLYAVKLIVKNDSPEQEYTAALECVELYTAIDESPYIKDLPYVLTDAAITVRERLLTGIRIASPPNRLTYYTNEALDPAGLRVEAVYDNEDVETVTGWTLTGYDAGREGTQTVTVSWGGKSAGFTVTVSKPPPTVPGFITSGIFSVKNGALSSIPVNTTAAQLLAGLNERQYIKIFSGSTEVSGNTAAGTGMTARLLDGTTLRQELTLIVTGDANGDGKITLTDYAKVKAHLLARETLRDPFLRAGDVNGDGKITLTDYAQLKAHLLDKSKITPKAH